jgi:hypothetical protein
MSNMSYCRFENTSNDMLDCLNAVGEAVDEGKTLNQFKKELSSSDERHAFDRLLQAARDFVEVAEQLEDTDDEV